MVNKNVINDILLVLSLINESNEATREYLKNLRLLMEEDAVRTYIKEVEEFGMSPEAVNDSDNKPTNRRYQMNKNKLERIEKLKSDFANGKLRHEKLDDRIFVFGKEIRLPKPLEEFGPEAKSLMNTYFGSLAGLDKKDDENQILADVKPNTEVKIELVGITGVEKVEGVETPKHETYLNVDFKSGLKGKLVFIPEGDE